MTTDYNLQFIRHQLNPIRNATMHTIGHHVLPMPNDVVTLLKVDDSGQMWFAGHQPRGWIKNYEQCFAARLFFYQKGVRYYIEASGNVFIANNEDILALDKDVPDGYVLMKMTPSWIEYTETGKRNTTFSPFKWVSTIRAWFVKRIPVYHWNHTRPA